MKKLWALFLVLTLVVGVVSPINTTVYASDGVVMTVNGTEYASHGLGWAEAVKLAKSGTDATVKLFADWIGESGNFVAKDASGIECGTKSGYIYIDTNGLTLDLNGHTVDRNDMEGGVGRVVIIENATFTIDDTSAEKSGKITGGQLIGFGYGAGVYVNNGNLILNGGSICENYSADAGGVYINNGTFTMNGGSVSNNTATGKAAGVYLEGEGTEFIMNGGEISNNAAAEFKNGTAIMSQNRKGGGLYADSKTIVTINGGSINNNTANNGAGVFLAKNATMNLNSGSIENNNATSTDISFEGFSGGGIHVDGGTLNMLGGTVKDNEARYGGGIYSSEKSLSKIIITGGKITGNIAQQQAGGIYHGATEKLIITDCDITDNESLNYVGGGVLVTQGADVYLGGTTKIINNKGYYTNPAFTISNMFLTNSESKLYNACGQAENVPDNHLETGADIGVGLSDEYIDKDKYFIHNNSGFTRASSRLISSDYIGNKLYINEENTESGKQYYLSLEKVELDIEQYKVAKLTIKDKTYLYDDFNKAWVDAVGKSAESPATLTLLEDWTCGYDGHFCDYESIYSGVPGYMYGTLYLNDSNIDLTVDLNGHKIDRNRYSPSKLGQVFTVRNGTLRIKDSAGGGKITGAYDCSSSGYDLKGGAIWVYNGNLYMEGGEISGNISDYRGGGILWESDGILCITGGKIVNNYVRYYNDINGGVGGGVYLFDCGDVYVGGNVIIDDNYQADGKESNLHFYDDDVVLKHAMGQAAGIPNAPLRDGAHIGIYAEDKEVLFTADNSRFREEDFIYFHSDDDRYFIRSVYDTSSATNTHKFYINSWGHEDSRYPRVKSVSIRNSELIKDAVLDYDKQIITLTAYSTKKNFFERVALANLIECTYDKDIYYLHEMNNIRDLWNTQEYKIMSDNGTYVICKVMVVPEGGTWAEEQEPATIPFNMLVTAGATRKDFIDFSEGWSYAYEQSISRPVTITLGADWIAPDGKFYSEDENGDEYGTKNGYLYLNHDNVITINLNGYKIDRNLNEPTDDGMVFWLYDYDAKLTIKDSAGGGKITGANNTGNGGAFFVERGSLQIEDGEITGNQAKNGAGIYWESQNSLCVYGGEIAGNVASENGAGIYGTAWGNMYFGGDVKILGNAGKGYENNNLYLEADNVFINRAAGQEMGIPYVPFTSGASIGISAYDTDALISGTNSCFDWYDHRYFFSDSDKYFIRKSYDALGGGNTYKFYIDSATNKPAQDSIVLSVTFEEGVTQEFTSFGEGWAYALKQSISKPTTITLYADWIADNGVFRCADEKGSEYGSKNGYLYINDDYNITIDLNGHKIDRNLDTATSDGLVFWLYDYDAKLTITDSVGGGKITGANNTGNGGAFFVERGSLYIEDGEITGNQAKNGAGIYWESLNNLCVYGGEISGNTAAENGGGIYGDDWGKMYFGGDVKILGNAGKGYENNNLYLEDDDVFVNQAKGQSADIPNVPLVAGATIGISAYDTDALISGENSCFDMSYSDFNFFFSDRDKYYIRSIYDVNGGNNALKLYISSKSDQLITNALTVKVEGGRTAVFDDFGDGWVYALKQSLTKPTSITLGADWIAPGGVFYCHDEDGDEYGSENGYLYLGDNYNLTIDLNGHKISRNLSEGIENGEVIYLEGANLVIDDSSEAGNGSITGGYNIDFGGGIYMDGGSLTLKGGNISGNKVLSRDNVHTTGHGGGIRAEDAIITIDGGSISDNWSDSRGGGIYAVNSTITLVDGSISGNEASSYGDGGGIYITDGCVLTIEGGEIVNNISHAQGGGVFVSGSQYEDGSAKVYMKGGIVGYNKTLYADGGGFSIRGNYDNMYMSGGTIIGNETNMYGGGIYWESHGTLALTGGVITENSTTGYPADGTDPKHNYGGGVYACYYGSAEFECGSGPYIGGDIQIFGNYAKNSALFGNKTIESNMYLYGNYAVVKQALGQNAGVPYEPLKEGAKVGISSYYGEKKTAEITDEYSNFDEASIKYLYSDLEDYYIKAVADEDYPKNTFKLLLLSGYTITDYDAQTKSASIYASEAGTYTVVFADCEDDCLANVDVVEYDFKEGINVVSQEVKTFTLSSGDKVMVWCDMNKLTPVCDVFIIK